MLKPRIELIRDGQTQALLTWHKIAEDGSTIPIAIEFNDALEEEMRQRVTDVCKRPINLMEDGKSVRAQPGSSKHFLGLPKVLARLGFRVRNF